MARDSAWRVLFGGLWVAVCLLILGAVLFPPGPGRHHSRRAACLSNLHQIALAVRMYREDNGTFPADLLERPIPPGENWYGPDGNLEAKRKHGHGLGALFPDYVSNPRIYSCPDNRITQPGAGGHDFDCQSYDGVDPAAGSSGNMAGRVGPRRVPYSDGAYFGTGARLKYARSWRVTWHGALGKPDPREPRQLLWARPPAGTVITWCHYHRRDPGGATLRPDDRDFVVFLDGSVCLVPSLSGSGHAAVPPQ